MWQLARILPCFGKYKDCNEAIHGKTIWVRPRKGDHSWYETQVGVDMSVRFVELLPEFADEVEELSQREFIARCEALNAVEKGQ